jgi:hypothetical protein
MARVRRRDAAPPTVNAKIVMAITSPMTAAS